MRKLANKAKRKLYKDESDIDYSIKTGRGDKMPSGGVNNSDLSNMVEGETRFDSANSREVTKIEGKLYKRIVDANSEVKLIEV